MKKEVLMWLLVAVVAVAAFLLVDPARYSKDVPTDQEIDQVGEGGDESGLTVEGNVEEEIPSFIE